MIRFQQIHEGDEKTNVAQRELLPQLLLSTNLDLELVLKYGHDFGLSGDEIRSLWLRYVLIRPKAASHDSRKSLGEDHSSGIHKLDNSYRYLSQPVLHDLKREIVDQVFMW